MNHASGIKEVHDSLCKAAVQSASRQALISSDVGPEDGDWSSWLVSELKRDVEHWADTLSIEELASRAKDLAEVPEALQYLVKKVFRRNLTACAELLPSIPEGALAVIEEGEEKDWLLKQRHVPKLHPDNRHSLAVDFGWGYPVTDLALLVQACQDIGIEDKTFRIAPSKLKALSHSEVAAILRRYGDLETVRSLWQTVIHDSGKRLRRHFNSPKVDPRNLPVDVYKLCFGVEDIRHASRKALTHWGELNRCVELSGKGSAQQRTHFWITPIPILDRVLAGQRTTFGDLPPLGSVVITSLVESRIVGDWTYHLNLVEGNLATAHLDYHGVEQLRIVESGLTRQIIGGTCRSNSQDVLAPLTELTWILGRHLGQSDFECSFQEYGDSLVLHSAQLKGDSIQASHSYLSWDSLLVADAEHRMQVDVCAGAGRVLRLTRHTQSVCARNWSTAWDAYKTARAKGCWPKVILVSKPPGTTAIERCQRIGITLLFAGSTEAFDQATRLLKTGRGSQRPSYVCTQRGMIAKTHRPVSILNGRVRYTGPKGGNIDLGKAKDRQRRARSLFTRLMPHITDSPLKPDEVQATLDQLALANSAQAEATLFSLLGRMLNGVSLEDDEDGPVASLLAFCEHCLLPTLSKSEAQSLPRLHALRVLEGLLEEFPEKDNESN